MQRHAASLPNGLGKPRFWQAHIIQGVPCFMQHAHHCGNEVSFIITGGQPHIMRCPTAEWMRADIQPPTCDIEPKLLHKLATQRFLPRHGKWSGQWRSGGQAVLFFQHSANQFR